MDSKLRKICPFPSFSSSPHSNSRKWLNGHLLLPYQSSSILTSPIPLPCRFFSALRPSPYQSSISVSTIDLSVAASLCRPFPSFSSSPLPFVQLFAPRPSGELNRLIPKSHDGIALARLHVAPSLLEKSDPATYLRG